MSRKNRKRRRIEVVDGKEPGRFGGSDGSGGQVASATPAPEGSEAAVAAGETMSELEALRAEVADLQDKLLRARAEQQNLTKRTANELSEVVRYANASLIKDLLATVDNFDRLEDQSSAADVDAIRKGVGLIRDDLMKVLERQGLQTVEAMDQRFDPRCHEAMFQQAAPGTEPGTVIQVYQPGYVLGDRVLRPAKVVVSAAAEGDGREASDGACEQECGAGAAESAREEG